MSTTEKAEIEAFAHLSTEDISAEVDCLASIHKGAEYCLSTPSSVADADATKLFRFRRELDRRLRAKIEADDAVSNAIMARLPVIHAETAAMWAMEAAE
jgi:hypothetical protein